MLDLAPLQPDLTQRSVTDAKFSPDAAEELGVADARRYPDLVDDETSCAHGQASLLGQQADPFTVGRWPGRIGCAPHPIRCRGWNDRSISNGHGRNLFQLPREVPCPISHFLGPKVLPAGHTSENACRDLQRFHSAPSIAALRSVVTRPTVVSDSAAMFFTTQGRQRHERVVHMD